MIDFLKNNFFNIITAIIAIYWAILSTLVYIKSKKWIRIVLSYHIIINWYFLYRKYDDKIIVSITNTWEWIEQISWMWFILDDWRYNFLTNIDSRVNGRFVKLSRKLNSKDNFKITFLKKEIVKYFEKHKLTPKYFYIWNTEWEIFKVKFDYKKIVKENNKINK